MQRPKKASKDAVDASVAAVNERVASEVARRKRIVRSFPAAPFEEPLAFAKQIFDFGSGETVQS